jgi:hypothetical protein
VIILVAILLLLILPIATALVIFTVGAVLSLTLRLLAALMSILHI